MSAITLEHENRADLAALLATDTWVVACLCAAWCDVCRGFRASFDQFAERHPDKHFLWIDIEDQADVVGDLDVENFPTLLMQRGDTVAFYGTILPDARVAERLLMAQVERSMDELRAEALATPERREWQENCNLRQRLNDSA